ncbi:uncharacterized protein CLUP02_02328 [Colletotrichum lupini]|uniref:Uncharacterized protein n=1 Tax=Colletotrichum lupini TaxID=145971 RepID=A0A9Q8SE18_9PEZI|nr:uncharacterized protein CLUP02_02328 [Colletotrichum lupini]UQC75672.1 hypothetical protein CLUP02_02328 [Colletotrichum lupini]
MAFSSRNTAFSSFCSDLKQKNMGIWAIAIGVAERDIIPGGHSDEVSLFFSFLFTAFMGEAAFCTSNSMAHLLGRKISLPYMTRRIEGLDERIFIVIELTNYSVTSEVS